METVTEKWIGHRLLIPIGIDALVRTKKGNGTAFSNEPLNIDAYDKFGKMHPAPFGVSIMPEPGVHLKWALPDALTNAVQNEEGDFDYPLVPNRWIVIRFSASNPNARKAFIVESDYLGNGPKGKDGHNSYLYHNEPWNRLDKKYLGRWFDYEGGEWLPTASTDKLFLTAKGVGEPAFAATVANSKFVFHFHDALVQEAASNFSYLVCGWYSNRESDPLNPPNGSWTSETEWLNVIEKFGWSVGTEADLSDAVKQANEWTHNLGLGGLSNGDYPVQSLFHADCLAVYWPGLNEMPQKSVPSFNLADPRDTPKIVIANNGMDGLASLVDWQLNFNAPATWVAQLEDLKVKEMLQAFTHRKLSLTGKTYDIAELKHAVHAAGFSTCKGGDVWMVQWPEANDAHDLEESVPPPLLTLEMTKQLENLNMNQWYLDQVKREREFQQQLLYMNWWKDTYNKSNFSPALDYGLSEKITAGENAIQALDDKIKEMQKKVSDAKIELKKLLTKNDNLELASKPAPNFFQPNDPTLLISGIKKSYKWGEDGRFTEGDASLFVRFTGQTLSNITVKIGNSNIVVNSSELVTPFAADTHIPKEIPALLQEAMLLDLDFAETIARKAKNGKQPAQEEVTRVQSQQINAFNAALHPEIEVETLDPGFNLSDGNQVKVPSALGVNYWVAPWNPLSLRWRVKFFPRLETVVSTAPMMFLNHELKNWAFNGEDYTSNDIPDPQEEGRIFEGSTDLTPKDSFALHAQLEKFLDENEAKLTDNTVPWQDILDTIKNWDVLSQAFTSFGDQLIQLDTEQFAYVPKYGYQVDIKTAIGEMGRGILYDPNPADSGFFPLRAGFLKIEALWITDEFGQVFSVLDHGTAITDGALTGEIPVIPGTGLSIQSLTSSLKRPTYVQLSPRIVQPARLELNFPLIDNKTQSPIYGWLVPNHVNKGLLVYDPDGHFRGQFLLVGETHNLDLSWQLEKGSTLNYNMNLFVQGLLTNGNRANAFRDFLETIDETQWGVIPSADRDHVNLSILVGHPIAMIAAEYRLDVYGDFAQRVNWNEDPRFYNSAVRNLAIPLQIGNRKLKNDGVMGFFGSSGNGQIDYSYFNAVDPFQGDQGPSGYVKNERMMIAPTSVQYGLPYKATILLDPRGHIHTQSGILPVLETILPEYLVTEALKNMELDFNMGPVLVHKDILELNLPTGVGNAWTWFEPTQRNGEVNWNAFADIAKANTIATLPVSPVEIRQGRLRLTGALGSELMLFFLEASGEGIEKVEEAENTYTVRQNVKPILRWTTQGATHASFVAPGSNMSGSWNVDLHASAYTFDDMGRSSTVMTLTVQNATGHSISRSITLQIV